MTLQRKAWLGEGSGSLSWRTWEKKGGRRVKKTKAKASSACSCCTCLPTRVLILVLSQERLSLMKAHSALRATASLLCAPLPKVLQLLPVTSESCFAPRTLCHS
jgi:hypothetical protein